MDSIKEQEEISNILKNMTRVIASIPYKKRQLVDFKLLIRKLRGITNTDLLRTCYNNQGIDFISMMCKYNKMKLLRYFLYETHILYIFTWENKEIELKNREDAVYYAMCLNNFEMIEMLYDHWTGDLHWLGHKKEYNVFDVENVNQIRKLLITTLEKYEKWILSKENEKRIINQIMLFNVQSLAAFSEFQTELYDKLAKLKKNLMSLKDEPVDVMRLRETYTVRNMILDILDCYEEHTKKPESIIQNSVYYFESNNSSQLPDFLETPENRCKLLHKTYFYMFFDVYFRKLDYNICLLVLDNLHLLKMRLIMPKYSYQKLENKVYHFINHVNNKWSLYIPNKRKMRTLTIPGTYNNINCYFSFKYNADIFERGLHIVYLERRDFETALYDFKTELKSRNVEESIRQDKIELPNEEVNCLMLVPELRDLYSLKRISQHVAQLYSIGNKYSREHFYLLVERTLQIVGEFLKSTDETLHLQPTTEALVETEMSVEVVNHLKSIRDLLCHAKDGELLKKIEIESNSGYIFDLIFTELIFVKKKIDEVIRIYKPLVEKALILNGLSLIENRKNEMPPDVVKDFFTITRRVRLFPRNIPYCELFWAEKGYAEEFMAEVIVLVEHSLQLESRLNLVTRNIRNNCTQKYFCYKESIHSSLQKIVEVKKNWQLIVQSLQGQIPPSITLLDYPNENDANRIKAYSKKVDLGNDFLKRLVEENTLFANAEIHWKFIKKLLQFIILKTEIKQSTPLQLEKVTQELQRLSYTSDNVEKIVNDYLVTIEEEFGPAPILKYRNECPEFAGIKELRRKLSMTNFLIQEEKKHLIDTLQNVKNREIAINNKLVDVMICAINKNEPIRGKEFTNFITTINLDEAVHKKLKNLVMGYKRDPLHPWCLSKRITLLRELTAGRTVHQLVTRYKLDKTFRLLLEVLVYDIFAILECTKNNKLIMKSGKLLTEINLRNFLIHGSPLLEIVGNILDSNDLPTELITKALELSNEERSINAQLSLMDLGFDFTKIRSNSLNTEEQALVNEFKMSPRWEDYLIFIPKLQHTIWKNHKELTDIDKNLLEAVKHKDSVLVQKVIVEGGNVNLVDDCKRAPIHYATTNRSVDVIRILLNYGADVNIRSKHNMTALHYSAMNGFTEIVDLLLKNGADCSASDDKGRTPEDLAHQRKHADICGIFAQAMKK